MADEDGPNKDELLERARDLEIEGRSSMNKDELAAAIAKAEKAKGKAALSSDFVTPREVQNDVPDGEDRTDVPGATEVAPVVTDETTPTADQSSLGGTGGTTTDFG